MTLIRTHGAAAYTIITVIEWARSGIRLAKQANWTAASLALDRKRKTSKS